MVQTQKPLCLTTITRICWQASRELCRGGAKNSPSNLMITLGLDPSITGFGWCVHNSTVLGKARVIDGGVFIDSEDVFVARYIHLRSQLVAVFSKHPEIEAVGTESPPFGESYSEGLYALFVYVNEVMYLLRKDIVYFDPSTLKMLAKMDPKVLQGSMDKKDMVAAAKAETGIAKWNHNVADAYLVARSAARFWSFESGLITAQDLTPAEAQSFHRVHTYKRGAKAGQTTQKGLVFREDDRFFKFSQIPSNPLEEEYTKWLLKRS